MAQTEIHPVDMGCRYLRGRFKLQPSRNSPFPERIFQRYECQNGHPIEGTEESYKCCITVDGCWQEPNVKWLTQDGAPLEMPIK